MDRPDWFPESDWLDWLEHRRKVKAVNSDRAIRAQLKQFQLIMARGWSVADIVDRQTGRGWKGIEDEWFGSPPRKAAQPHSVCHDCHTPIPQENKYCGRCAEARNLNVHGKWPGDDSLTAKVN